MADSNEILKVRGLNVLILRYFLIYFGSGVKKAVSRIDVWTSNQKFFNLTLKSKQF